MGTDHQKLVGYKVDHNGVCHNGWSVRHAHCTCRWTKRAHESAAYTKEQHKQHKQSTFGLCQLHSEVKSRLNTGLRYTYVSVRKLTVELCRVDRLWCNTERQQTTFNDYKSTNDYYNYSNHYRDKQTDNLNCGFNSQRGRIYLFSYKHENASIFCWNKLKSLS